MSQVATERNAHTEKEPTTCRPKDDFEVFPLTEVGKDVRPGWLPYCKVVAHPLLSPLLRDWVNLSFLFVVDISLDIRICFLDIMSNIKGISRRFRDGDSVIESKHSRHGSKANDDSPSSIAC